MTQTYTQPVALVWMRAGKCPECGEYPAEHSAALQFWLRPGAKCDLLPRGVADRIEAQIALDAGTESTGD